MTQAKLESFIGETPLVQAVNMVSNVRGNKVLIKIEGNNPAGSVKDRPAFSMIARAEERGDIRKGDTLLEATSGNTGIALAMVSALRGYSISLIMPENQSIERRKVMAAYGANLILVPEKNGMEKARDLALQMEQAGEGKLLNQFSNPDNPLAHYEGTAPEIWRDTEGKITHFVSSMGTTGTITGCSKFFKEKNTGVKIVGVQPADGAQIPGIRKWPKEYLPKFFDPERVDELFEVSRNTAEETMRRMAREEGIFCGISSGGAMWVAMQIEKNVKDAVIVTIACDRGDRYLSEEVF